MSNRPSKEAVRTWLQQRQTQPAPLPSIAQIQYQLGWKQGQSTGRITMLEPSKNSWNLKSSHAYE